MDSWTCKKCGAFYRERKDSLDHVCGAKAVDVAVEKQVESVVEHVATAEAISPKYTKESLEQMNKAQVIDLARSVGIDRIGEKYLSQCRVGDIEDAIIAAQK